MEGAENIMSEERKSKAELLQELNALRQRICELEQANQAHQNFESQFKELFENTPVGIYRTTPDGRIIMANPALIQMLGYSSFEELSQRDLEKEGFAQGYPRSAFKDLIEKDGKVVGLESAWIKRDGTLLFIIENARAIRDESGKILYYEGIVQDITGRKKTQEATRQTEGRLHLMAETGLDYIFQTTIDGTTIYCSPAVERILGYAPEERQGQNFASIISPSDLPKAQALFKEAIKGKSHQNIEINLVHKSGRTVPVEVSVAPIFENNKVNSIFGIVRDITERKKAEDRLRKTRERLEYILTTSPATTYTCKVGGDWPATFISENIRDQFGYEPHRLIEDTNFWPAHIHPDDRQRVFAELSRLIDSNFHVHEYRFLHKDGHYRWVHDEVRLIRDEQGKPLECIGYWTDITERKKIEQKLRASEDKNRTLLENLPQKIFLKDRSSVYLSCNENLAKDFKIKAEEIVGKTDYDLFPKELAEKYRADDKQIIELGWTKDIEEKYIQEGQEFIVHTVKTPVKDRQGNIIGVLGIFWDITEHKKAEQKLQESEEKYRQVVSTTTDAIWLFDTETKQFVEINKACEELYGYSREEFLNLKQSDITAEPEKTNESINQILEGKLHRIPVRYHRKKDGTVFPVEISAGTFELGGRRVLCGVIRDITDRKKTEEKIRALSSAIEQSIDGIAIGDLEPRLLYVNKAYARMHDYTPEEMIGMPVAKLHNEEQTDTLKARIHQIKTQGFWADEIGHVKKDGTAFPTYISVTLLKDSNGQPTGILAVTRDITELKQREKEFDDYRQKMARAEQLASLGTLGAGLAHELTQPLTVITLLIENVLTELEKAPCPGTVDNKLKDVLAEVSKVTSITKKFRSAVRKSSERAAGQVDLKAVAQRTIELFNESARQAKITLDLTGLDKLPNIYSSEEKIEQLFFALVENAIHAADVEKDCRLVISGAVKDNYVELQFSDNCGGIAPENLDKIFEPFFTTKPIGAATGLGLCIAEHIVSRAGGKIHVESKLGKGTTFYFTLPIKSHEKFYPKYR